MRKKATSTWCPHRLVPAVSTRCKGRQDEPVHNCWSSVTLPIPRLRRSGNRTLLPPPQTKLFPPPPSTVSPSSSPFIRSSSAPPYIMSRPSPPFIVSFPALPYISSEPASPYTVSFPEFPSRT